MACDNAVMDTQAQARLRRSAFPAHSAALPPHLWFGVSAVFHYLGPSFAVLLFAQVGVLGMAWLRIASAALVFAPLTRPWRTFRRTDRQGRVLVVALGVCLAAMNCCFYLALDRLPISLVAAIEFVGTIGVALAGARTARNLAALGLAVGGVLLLIDLRWSSDPLGLVWALLNGAFFVAYIMLGHRLSRAGGTGGIVGLGAAMAVAFVLVLPVGLGQALPAFSSPPLLLAAAGVGICSSVIPYVCDQLAMARLPRASFALMLCLLPVIAAVTGAAVLGQMPTVADMTGIALVVLGVAIHRPAQP
jgi:inner membrane transporter RhtA